MKSKVALLFLIALTVRADEQIAIDLSLVARLPALREQAVTANAITGADSTPDVGRKREAYFLTLRCMAEDLRAHYYQHDEFPSDVFAGIEDRVSVLVASQYPMSPTTGASYVGFLRDSYRIQLAEETVCTLVESILSRSKETDVKVTGGSRPTFREWMNRWKEAGEKENGPNQALQTTPVTRSEI